MNWLNRFFRKMFTFGDYIFWYEEGKIRISYNWQYPKEYWEIDLGTLLDGLGQIITIAQANIQGQTMNMQDIPNELQNKEL